MRIDRCWGAMVVLMGAAWCAGGCVAHAQAGGYGDANAPATFNEPPTLVNVDGDVWVVQDANDTVYYVDGYYWSSAGASWRRSRFYDQGWGPVERSAVPVAIVQRDARAYVHYRGGPGARTRPAPRESVAADAHRRDDDHRGPDKNEHGAEHAERKEEHGAEHAERKEEHGDRKEGGKPGERRDEHSDGDHRPGERKGEEKRDNK